MLCVPPPVWFALLDGVVQLGNLEPVPKSRFPGDQVRAWKLPPRAWLAFRPQVAKYFSSVPVLCAVWICTHTTNSYLLLPHQWFFFLFVWLFWGEEKSCEEHVEAAPFGNTFPVCYTCTLGTGKSCAAASRAERREQFLHNRDVFILNVTKSIFNGVTEQK